MKAINAVQKNGLIGRGSIISRVNSNRCENKNKASTNQACNKEGMFINNTQSRQHTKCNAIALLYV